MRIIVLISLVLISNSLTAQSFEDGFSDGDFTTNPTWTGDIGDFLIFELDGNNVIRLNSNEASTSYLSTPSINVVGGWEFFVRIDGNTPSNNNKAEVVLMSDLAVLTDTLNGYSVRVGETGEDVFKIIRLDKGVETTILSDTTIIQSSASYRVKVTRDINGNWSLEVGEGYNGELKNSGNTIIDDTYTVSSFFGFRVSYTTTRTDDFYFDFKIDPPIVVVQPLLITSLQKLSQTEIDLSFTRDIDIPGISTTDFILNKIINPLSFTNQGSDVVRLTFTDPIPSGKNSLFISGIESTSNDTVLTDTVITFLAFDTFKAGDILINEFLKDPPPGSGLSEYIELKNVSSKYLNLMGWSSGDSNTLTSLSDTALVILPDSFLVLTNNPDALSSTFGIGPYLDVSLPALNNTVDQIRLFDHKSVLVDSLEYNVSWGGVDVALERRLTSLSSTVQANWGDSPNEVGTPGKENDVELDLTAPFLETAFLPDHKTVILKFSEALAEESALETSNYSISPFKNIESISVFSDTVKLIFSPVLSDGEPIRLVVKSQSDIFGNARDTSGVVNLTYFEIAYAKTKEVVFNEILYKRKDELSPEFVELHNPSDKNFDLSGWELVDATNKPVLFPEGTFLPSGEYIVLTDRMDFASSVNNGMYLSGFPSLNDNGDALVIKNKGGVTIDSLFYQDTWGGNIPGVSLERKDPLSASNDISNWATSSGLNGFTAGSQSSVFEEDVSPPAIIFSTQRDSTVLVVFSEFVRIGEETTFRVNGEISKVINFDSTKANRLVLKWFPVAHAVPAKLSSNFNTEVILTNLQDVKGNLASEVKSMISSPASKGTVVINEILFSPLANNEDNLPDQTEYIELFNPTHTAISLEGLSLHDAPDEENEVRSIFPVSTQHKWIEPGGYFLIYSEDEVDIFSESKVARYFGIEEQSDQFTMQVDRSSLSLASNRDAIYMADSSGITIDSVFYDENWQNPNVFDTDGIALERIDPTGPGNDASNWSSSTHPSGGTPNARNSIFQETGSAPDDIGLNFSTNPFSPDDDGFEDNLFINYRLEAADYLLRVRIFDRYGREVRELVNGIQAGFEGSLIWDGLTDDKRKNRVGIYIILFEAYNSSNGKNRMFKETVVLARMF